jgi:KDO2-lipid IV(A) lauroyltransferase
MKLYHKKVSLGKRISHVIEYIFTEILGLAIYLLPFSSLDKVAAILRTILMPLLPSAKERVRNNVSFYYPNKTSAEIDTFIKRNLQNTLRVTLEVFQTGKFAKEKFIKKYLEPADQDSIDLFVKRNKGIVGIQGHFGNWELPVLFYYFHGVNVAFSAKHLSNPYVDRKLHRRRTRYGGKIVYLDESMKLIRELKNGNVVGLVADQDAGNDGIFVDFLGRKAATFPGPALLSYLTQSDLVLATNIFQGKGKYKVRLQKIHDATENSNFKDRDEAVAALTQKWSTALEKEVLKYPEQYFWIHRRWKTRPPEEK